MKLTKSELEIMNVLWDAERPLSRADILSHSDKTWKDNSIHILLNGMLKKGAIMEDGFVRSGKVWGRLYAPTLSIGDYYWENLFHLNGEKFYPTLLEAMLRDENLSFETLKALYDIIVERFEKAEKEEKEKK